MSSTQRTSYPNLSEHTSRNAKNLRRASHPLSLYYSKILMRHRCLGNPHRTIAQRLSLPRTLAKHLLLLKAVLYQVLGPTRIPLLPSRTLRRRSLVAH
jgi:hypothetical protein